MANKTNGNGYRLYKGKYPVPEEVDYVIEYIYGKAYWQLVRISDEAILGAFTELEQLQLHCWFIGVSRDKVVII